MGSRLLAIAALSGALLLGPARPSLGADAPPPTQAEFVSALEQAKGHLSAGRGEQGLKLLSDPPVWFNEGMATYYEAMTRVAGELKTDMPRAQYLDALAGHPLVPLEQFLFIRPKDFYATSPHSYAQAWLLVHMLQHGSPKHRDLFRAYLAKLENSAGAEATHEVFDEATIKALDGDLAKYLASFQPKK